MGETGDGQVSRDVKFACRIHPAAQSDIGKQQWVTGFHCVCEVLIVYQDGDYLYPCLYSHQSVERRLDDTVFGAGTFSWQDPVHSWKACAGKIMTVEKFIY